MALRFLDTNVLLRYLTRDDEQKAQVALALLTRVERGEERVVTSHMVIFETIFTLQRFYRVPRQQIRALVEPILSLRGLQLPDKLLYAHAFDLYLSRPISFADSFNAAYMLDRGLEEVYTWDEDFDTLPGLRRVDPAEGAAPPEHPPRFR